MPWSTSHGGCSLRQRRAGSDPRMRRDFVSPLQASSVSTFLGSDSEAGKSRNKSGQERGTKLSDRTPAFSTQPCCWPAV